MIKFTASYTNANPNFIIKNISKTKEVSSNELAIIYVIKNILQRARYINPSSFLKEHLGYIDKYEDSLYILKKYTSNWSNTIKGFDPTENYPALTFFEQILPKYLKEYSFLTQLILPEAYVNDILKEPTLGEKAKHFFKEFDNVLNKKVNQFYFNIIFVSNYSSSM